MREWIYAPISDPARHTDCTYGQYDDSPPFRTRRTPQGLRATLQSTPPHAIPARGVGLCHQGRPGASRAILFSVAMV